MVRAANGVVLVTTKKGAIGKARVTYDFSYGWQSPWRQRKMLNASQYATLMMMRLRNMQAKASSTTTRSAWAGYELAGCPVQRRCPGAEPPAERERRFRRKVNYYFSAGYYNQEGIIGGNYDRSNYERLSFRSNTMYVV